MNVIRFVSVSYTWIIPILPARTLTSKITKSSTVIPCPIPHVLVAAVYSLDYGECCIFELLHNFMNFGMNKTLPRILPIWPETCSLNFTPHWLYRVFQKFQKAVHKRGNSTRKISKQLKNKGLPGSAATVWRYVTEKRMETFETKKAPTSEQQPAESSLARKYRKFTADEWKLKLSI